jgi:hypothetical protein
MRVRYLDRIFECFWKIKNKNYHLFTMSYVFIVRLFYFFFRVVLRLFYKK